MNVEECTLSLQKLKKVKKINMLNFQKNFVKFMDLIKSLNQHCPSKFKKIFNKYWR